MIVKRLSEVTDAEFSRLFDRGAAVREVMDHVQKIVSDVRENGDTALMQYTLEYDKADIVGLRVTEGELLAAYKMPRRTSSMRCTTFLTISPRITCGRCKVICGFMRWLQGSSLGKRRHHLIASVHMFLAGLLFTPQRH